MACRDFEVTVFSNHIKKLALDVYGIFRLNQVFQSERRGD